MASIRSLFFESISSSEYLLGLKRSSPSPRHFGPGKRENGIMRLFANALFVFVAAICAGYVSF